MSGCNCRESSMAEVMGVFAPTKYVSHPSSWHRLQTICSPTQWCSPSPQMPIIRAFRRVRGGTMRESLCRICWAVLPGLFIADVVPTFGMINMIGGECDR